MADAAAPAGALAGVLAGTWQGSGVGEYPTIEPFAYGETVTFTAVPGKPVLAYTQRTANPDSGEPMHAETGFVRLAGPDAVEWVVAQPTGVTESHTGTVTTQPGGSVVIDCATTAVTCTPTAKQVGAVRRRLVVAGDTLDYELWMQAVDQPMGIHLRAGLVRTTQ